LDNQGKSEGFIISASGKNFLISMISFASLGEP